MLNPRPIERRIDPIRRSVALRHAPGCDRVWRAGSDERDPKRRLDGRIADRSVRPVICGDMDRIGSGLGCHRSHDGSGVTMTHDEVSAERLIESRQRPNQVGAADVGGVIPHTRVDDKKWHDVPIATGSLREGGVVVQAEVSTEPHD